MGEKEGGVEEMKSYQFNPTLLFWGPPGSQKTRLASRFPSPVFLDVNKGLSSITDVIESQNATYIDINCWNDIAPALIEIKSHPEWKTIVCDDVTTLAMVFALEHANARSKKTSKLEPIQYQDYGQSSGNLRVALYQIWSFKDRIRIFTATDELESEKVQFGMARAGERGKDPIYTGDYGRVPAVPGKMGSELMSLCNEVWYFTSKSGINKTKWTIRTCPDGGLLKCLKDRSGKMPEIFDNTNVDESWNLIRKELSL